MDPDSPAEVATETTERTDSTDADDSGEVQQPEVEDAKQIYLRTVYPLNPGIPHFVDVPGGW